MEERKIINNVAWQRMIRDKKATTDTSNHPQNVDIKQAVLKEITRKEATSIILEYEWLGTMGTTQFYYGIYFDNQLAGAVCFGYFQAMQGHKDRKAPYATFIGDKYAKQGIQLTRGACVYWAHEHSASKLIGYGLKEMKKKGYKYVVAFSDPKAGEIGTVYQATNWYYVGFGNSPSHHNIYYKTGKLFMDSRDLSKKYGLIGLVDMRIFIENKPELEIRTQEPKAKYIYLLGNHKENREMLLCLKDKIKPYPKRTNFAGEVSKQTHVASSDESLVKVQNPAPILQPKVSAPKVKKEKIKEEPIIAPLHRAKYTEPILMGIYNELANSPIYILDLETTGLDTRHDKITSMGLGTLTNTWYLFQDEVIKFTELGLLTKLISDEKKTMVGQNLLFDLDFLYNNGFIVKNQLWDTKAAAFLIDENRSLHLKDLGKTMFNLEVIKFKEVNWTDENLVEKYGKQDIDITRMVYNEYKKEIDTNYPIFYKLYMPLIWTIIDAQNNGIKINTEYLKDIFWELKDDIEDLQAQLDAEVVNINRNYGNKIEPNDELFNSPKQLREIFFGVLGLEPIHVSKKTKEASTDERTLHALAVRGCTLANLLLRYREKNKLFTTYVQPILEKTDPVTGRLHTTYNPYSTATGRWNSQKPNLQNIPVSTKDEGLIRKAFVAEPGKVLLISDYSQIELRLLAHFSKDTLFQLAYTKGLDLHKKTASAMFHKAESMVTEQERGMGKTINFAIIYGISAFRLAEKFNIPMWTAKKYIDAYFELYKGVTAYRKNVVAECKRNGYVETLFFRKRRLPDIQTFNSSRSERQAVNAQIQGSAADILNRAIVQLHQKYRGTDLKILLQVHDEIVLECSKEKADMYMKEVKDLMQGVVKLSVPLICSVKACENWSEK